jgi:hypothetical protein
MRAAKGITGQTLAERSQGAWGNCHFGRWSSAGSDREAGQAPLPLRRTVLNAARSPRCCAIVLSVDRPAAEAVDRVPWSGELLKRDCGCLALP